MERPAARGWARQPDLLNRLEPRAGDGRRVLRDPGRAFVEGAVDAMAKEVRLRSGECAVNGAYHQSDQQVALAGVDPERCLAADGRSR
jgi:hypothetical protein